MESASSSSGCGAAEKVCSIEDLLSQVLARLPLCSLRRFKSVCKRWLSIITDPTFNALLHSRSIRSHKGLLFQLQSASSVFLYVPLPLPLPLNNNNNNPLLIPTTISFPYKMTRSSQYDLEILHSCNGLLTCYERPDSNKLYVYNPTINQSRLLPPPHVLIPYTLVKVLALAFDPALSPHYKILYACQDLTSPGRRVHVEIYSSQTGCWRVCPRTFSFSSFITFDKRVVYWRGALHWLSRLTVSHFTLDGDGDFIHVEDHRALYGITYGIYDRLLVSRDCLLLVRVLQPEPPQIIINIYEMKDRNCYSAGWSLKYRVNLESAPPDPAPTPNVLSVMLGEEEEEPFLVLEVTGGSTLLRYNIISNTFHHLCDLTHFRLRGTMCCSFFFTPSLSAV